MPVEIERLIYTSEHDGRQFERDIQRVPKAVDAAWNRVVDIENKTAAISERIQKRYTNISIKERKRLATEAVREIERIRRAEEKAEQESQRTQQRIFQGSFKGTLAGSFLGSGAAGAISSAVSAQIDALQAVAAAGLDAGVKSVKLAGDFEVTRNAIEVFAGSARLANRELAAIDKTARDTAGLRLVTAEEGYQQLRGLSFQAQIARGFIKELGEEKILSGAQDAALERIIFNFSQIASGGQKVSQELREIFTQMPSLRKSFFEAFGTLDPQKIQRFFDEDTNKAFQRLIDAMARGKAVTGGFNDSLGKFYDELTRTGRAAGEPLLEPLTDDIRDLTELLAENRAAFRDWGQYAADVIRGVSDAARHLSRDPEARGQAAAGWEIGQGLLLGVPRAVGGILAPFEELGRQGRPPRKRNPENPLEGTPFGFLGPVVNPETREERFTRELQAEQDRLMKAEASRAKFLENSKNLLSESLSYTEQTNRIQEARLTSHLDYTAEQELATIKSVSRAREGSLRQQLAVTQSYYNDLFKYGNLSHAEEVAATREKNEKVAKLNTELAVNEAATQKQIQQFEKRIQDERRQAALEFKNLQVRETQSFLDSQTFQIERNLSLQGDTYREGYADLIKVTVESNDRIFQLTRESYADRLADLRLTAEQRANLEKQMGLELENLNEQTSRRILEIQDRQLAAQIERLNRYRSQAAEVYRSFSELYSEIGSTFFNPQTFDSSTLKSLHNSLFATNRRGELQNLIEGGFAAERAITAQPGFNPDALIAAIDKTQQFYQELERLKNGIPPVFYDLENLAKQIGEGNVKAFDDAAKALLRYRQLLEREDLDAEIAHTKDLIGLATKHGNAIELQTQTFKLNRLERDKTRLSITQAAEATSLYQNSTEGLTARLNDLRSGSKEAFAGLRDIAQPDVLREQINRYEESIFLEEKLARVSEDTAIRYKNAWLSATLAVKEADIQARESMIASQVRISDSLTIHQNQINASVWDAIASTQSLTEVLSDAQSGAIRDAYAGVDAAVHSLADALGIAETAAGNFFETMVAGLAKLALQQAFQWLFGAGGGPMQLGGDTRQTGGGGGFLSKLLGWGVGALLGGFGGGFKAGDGSAGHGISIGDIFGKAEGGLITGGIPGKDSVPALLMPEEYVNRKEAVDYYGVAFFEALNQKRIRKFSRGGSVRTLAPGYSFPGNYQSGVDEARAVRNGSGGAPNVNVQLTQNFQANRNGQFDKPSAEQSAKASARALNSIMRRG